MYEERRGDRNRKTRDSRDNEGVDGERGQVTLSSVLRKLNFESGTGH